MTAPEGRECPVVEQAVGWALHALEPEEELSVARHVPGCAVCRAAVRETEELVAGLGASVEQVEPPPSLRARLMDAVAETPQTFTAAPRREPVVDRDVPPHEPAAAERQATRPPLPGRTPAGRTGPGRTGPAGRSWLSRRRLVVGAVALVAAVAIGGFGIQTAQLQAARTGQAQAISDLVGALARSGEQHAVLATADGTTVGAVVLDSGQRQVLAVGMPVTDSDHTYVLWGLPSSGNGPVALGTFAVTSAAPSMESVGSAAAADGYTGYAVSLEPGHQAPAAPSSVMAKGAVA